jgi:Sulfotransferase family
VQNDEFGRVQALGLLSALDLLSQLLDPSAVDPFEGHDACKCHFTLLAVLTWRREEHTPCENRAVPGIIDAAANQLRVARRLAPRRGASLGERFGRLDDRLVFVIGSPRSGTTFLAEAIGSLPGFVDLGEVAPVKAAVPELAALAPDEASRRLRRILNVSRRVGLVGSVRAVEQTPELAHLVTAIPSAFPESVVVHIVRDGRDVACSLLEKPWLRREQVEADDAGVPYGAYARFWVEPDRRAEFETASDARRAAWVWRSYVAAARVGAAVEIRYEAMAADPYATAAALAPHLEIPVAPLADALSRAHAASVGRHLTDLSAEQLGDVEAEAGALLRELGYVSSASA